jgi:4-diphosphocytidyl-2-C-methyl-D-erythritol kinase
MTRPRTSDGPSFDWRSDYPAPAKLNLFLHVTGRRADGYHLLQTAFRFVDFGDTLRFSPREDEAVVRVDPLPGVAPADDLTVRAAEALRQASGCRHGVDIHLEKRLPMGGGLGGGSSDAATTLLALNHLWALGLPRQALQRIALTLGADVPVFVFGDNAFAEGVGERLRPLSLPPAWYLVLVPPLAIATADIFRAAELARDTPPIDPHAWKPGDGRNDLQAVAVERYPLLAEYLEWLGRHGDARMSGSGACVFAGFASEARARAAFAARPPGYAGFVAAGRDHHPLRALARD